MEGEIKMLLERVHDMESRLHHTSDRTRQSAHAHSIKTEHDNEAPETYDPYKDPYTNDKELTSQEVNAYIAEVGDIQSTVANSPWNLDLGALNHIWCDASVFSSLTPSSRIRITSANGQRHIVEGIRNVAIRLPSGEILHINKVPYSPGTPKLRIFFTSYVLELVHTNIAGPFWIKSLSRELYYFLFVDNYSKKTCI